MKTGFVSFFLGKAYLLALFISLRGIILIFAFDSGIMSTEFTISMKEVLMKLIIAEKPSLARNITAAIGNSKFSKKDGYFESADYIVTFGFGHLFGLLDLEEYSSPLSDDEKPTWTLEGLPFRPHKFRFGLRKDAKTHKIDSGVRKQFETIKKLCARSDVDGVINAGDADREGEIIVRIILQQAGNTKPVWRLWMPDQTPDTIRGELRALKRDENYDNLANEGFARTYIDWMYGINLTRLATLKSGTLLRVGRVIVPIVKAIYDRDMEIRNFVPHKYLGITSKVETTGEIIELTSKRSFELTERDRAKALCDTYNSAGAVVSAIKKEKKAIQAGKLYSLSKLQGVLGKKFKMSPKESLAIVQDLYEAGYVSYPRTNSEYLATTQRESINGILAKLKDYGYKVCPKDHKGSIYDDSKIESHSALTPTNKIAKKEDLKENEWKVYSTIFNRFLAVFCSEDCVVDHTTIEIRVGDMETFKIKGDVFLSKGWMQYDDTGKSDKILPSLSVGDTVNIDFKVVDRETKPPAHYTVDSLNKYLKNPFRKEKVSSADSVEDTDSSLDAASENLDSDSEEYTAMFEGVELGTEATRTGIIETAIHTGYIALKNNVYTILPGGEFLIESIHKLHINMDKEKTAELGKALKRVYRGELSVEDSVTFAFQEIRQSFTAASSVTINAADMPKGAGPEVVGKCPKCGSDVIERDKSFSCSNKDCKFVLWKDNKLLASIGKKLNKSIAKQILKGEKILLRDCKSAKTGNQFNCTITPDLSGEYVNLNMELAGAEDLSIGACPKCGSPVVEREKLFGCSNKDCRWAIFKDDRFFAGIGRKPNAAIVKSLLSKKKVNLKDCVSQKSGKKFNCTVYVDFSGKWPQYKIEFLNGKKEK